MSVVVDASVATILVTRDARKPLARRVFEEERDLAAPAFLLVETANALWKMSLLDALASYVTIELAERLRFVADADLLDDACALAGELRHPVYDCLYLALAVREGAPLITFDRRFATRLADTRFADTVSVPE